MTSVSKIKIHRLRTGSNTLELADEHATFFAGRADSDGDGVDDSLDDCPNGNTGWTSVQSTTDHDEDGCEDNSSEDLDDDNDGVADLFPDNCPTGFLSWTSTGANDYDSDGCKDSESEENDDDNDGVLDGADVCDAATSSDLGWISVQATTDHDEDGCRDAGEDLDDDDDGVADTFPDICPTGVLGWTSNGFTDYDGDGCRDSDVEETDDDNDGVLDGADDVMLRYRQFRLDFESRDY